MLFKELSKFLWVTIYPFAKIYNNLKHPNIQTPIIFMMKSWDLPDYI
jgi:hypothetical protein